MDGKAGGGALKEAWAEVYIVDKRPLGIWLVLVYNVSVRIHLIQAVSADVFV
jgi:hypothetical protein